MSKFFVALFTIHLLSSPLLAEAEEIEVFLENGDRLSGQLISRSDEELVLKVAYLGEVKLDSSLISKVEEKQSVALAAGASDSSAVPANASLPEGQENSEGVSVVAEKSEQSAPVSKEEQASLDKGGNVEKEQTAIASNAAAEASGPEKGGLLGLLASWEEEFNPLPKWKKNLQFGFNSTTGRRDLSTLNYRLDMSRKIEKSRLNFNADYAYGEANGSANLDKFATKFRWRKDISPGVFYEAESLYSSDSIKLIDSNLEQKVGLGTRLLDSETSTLSAGVGAIGRWREVNQGGTESGSLVNVFQDWDFRLTEKVSVKQDFKFAMPLDETDNYEVDFAASLRSEVTKSINLSVRFQLGFDNSLPKESREDRRLISSLGYSF